MPGGRGPLAVLGRCHQEAPRRLVNHRHLPFANRFIAMLHASGAASTLQRRGIPHTRHSCGCASVPPDPTQLRAKAHFCDRHHIASAVCGANLILVDRQRHVRRSMKTQPRPGGASLCAANQVPAAAGRSIACAICSCSSAIFVKPFARRRGDSSRDFSRSSWVDIGCPLEQAAARGACRAGDVLGAPSAPMRTPPRAWGIRAPTERGSEIPRGDLGGWGV